MADPLSITASIIAILQLSGVVVGYLKDVKDASKYCHSILVEIDSTSGLLLALKNLITGGDTEGSYLAVVRSLAVPHGPLVQFRSTLERLSEMVRPANGFSKAAILKWPFKKVEVKELLLTIERLKSLFSLALQNDSVRLSRGIEANLVEIKRAVLLQGQQSRGAEDLDIVKWLTPSKPREAHLHVRERRLHGTGQWLLEEPKFVAWRDEEHASSILCCHGIPGAGKTVISSLVIDHLNEKFAAQDVGTVFFYCDFQNPQSQSAVNIVASLLKQSALLKSSVMESVNRLYEKHKRAETYPDLSELETAFLSASQNFGRMFLVIDALDECDIDIHRGLLLKVLENLGKSSLRIFLTSRPHPDDIMELFRDSPQITIEASGEDIERYVRATIEESGKAARIMGNDLKEEAVSKIRDKAQGMFLLPRLQIQTILRKKNKREMREALQELPTFLNDIFKDTLLRIRRQSEENVELAMKTLEWIFLAKRPLSVQELRQGLSVRSADLSLDEEGYSLPEDMVDACLGLVILDGEVGTIRFVHFTVQEYLLSKAMEVFTSQGTQLTKACLTFLLFDEFRKGPCPDNESLENRLQDYRFFDYVSHYWGVHLKECPDGTNDELALTLLKTEPCVLSILQNTHHNGHGDYSQRYTKLSALHLAASFGLDTQVKAILDSGIDVNASNEETGGALHLAIKGSHDHTVLLLLQHGADLSLVNEGSATALHLAAEVGSLAIITLLCDAGADLLAIDGQGRTALHIAAEGSHADVCRFLIERGMDVGSEDRGGDSILHEAAGNGDVDIAKLLLENGANASALNSSRATAMHRAAWSGHESVFRILHEYGCKIDPIDDMGRSPLYRAAGHGHTQLMRFLIEKGADPERIDSAGASIIHKVADGGNAASVQLLLDCGVDINVKTKMNETVIHKAAVNADVAVLPLLVEKGAILDHAKNDNGQTPLHLAATYGVEANARYLIGHGADMEIACRKGWTPLLTAMEYNNDAIATFLINNGADTTKIGWNGNTILHKAAQSCSAVIMRLLLENGADVNLTNKDKKTALHMRAQEQDIEGAQLLIDAGVDINARDRTGITALHEALESGNHNLALLLISEGADVTAKSSSGNTVFHFAAMGIYKQAVFQLLLEKGAGLETRNEYLYTPLHYAAQWDNSVMIRFQVQNGADVTVVTKSGSTVLQTLAAYGGNPESAELLIAHGADSETRTSSGSTLLHLAVSSCDSKEGLIRLLVEKGADVNAANNDGITVLHTAAKDASEAIVRYLIEKGADVNAKTAKGTSVIHLATENGDLERMISFLTAKGADIEERDLNGRTCLLRASGISCRLLVRCLVDRGANVLARSKVGNTVLHQSSVFEDTELVKYLLDKGASTVAVNEFGISVLHVAIERGPEETVRLLVEAGANPKCVDKKGLSALHRAVKRGNPAVVTFLLEKGASIEAKDRSGRTALHIAAETQDEAIMQLLVRKGDQRDVSVFGCEERA